MTAEGDCWGPWCMAMLAVMILTIRQEERKNSGNVGHTVMDAHQRVDLKDVVANETTHLLLL